MSAGSVMGSISTMSFLYNRDINECWQCFGQYLYHVASYIIEILMSAGIVMGSISTM